MSDRSYERLGYFYLGKAIDPESGERAQEPFLYDSRDLLTHAVILGMTGSGKTGMGVALLEEGAIDGVPALVVDPKGDLANLFLAFPELEPAQFLPYVREEDAARKGTTREVLAAEIAARWRSGLAAWDQDGERVRRYREAARPLLMTPGSDLGRPLAVFGSLRAPAASVLADREALRDRVEGTVSSLLALAGIGADPLQSREHILISHLLEASWRAEKDLDLAGLISALQHPPFSRLGALELETFFPERDRFALALRLNHLLAAPGFEVWLRGEPLALDSLLWDSQGRPRLAIVSLAHLSDPERMFVVSLLASEAVSWMRAQGGSSVLRAIFYMDEVFGYLPPIGEPPSKRPLLTLLKQARASGLGLVLATQNPVDLDYKALSNVGTWLLGRLQTERDKLRVLDGLEGLANPGGWGRSELDRILSGLAPRRFLVHDVHRPGPNLVETRWVLNYLAGPLDRHQLRELGRAVAGAEAAPARAAHARGPDRFTEGQAAVANTPPLLPPGVVQRFAVDSAATSSGLYRPALFARAHLAFERSRPEVRHQEERSVLVWFGDGASPDLRTLRSLDPDRLSLAEQPLPGWGFTSLPAPAARADSYGRWREQIERELARSAELRVFEVRELGVVSRPGEAEREFRIRLGTLAREEREKALERIRKRWESRLAGAEDRVRRAEHRVAKEQEEASTRKLETALSAGSALLGALFGRKALSATTVTRASSTLRSASRSQQAAREADLAAEQLQQARAALARIREELEQELGTVASRFDLDRIGVEVVSIRPRRSDVELLELALLWVPIGGALEQELRSNDGGGMDPAEV